jgi:hypothetical protein
MSKWSKANDYVRHNDHATLCERLVAPDAPGTAGGNPRRLFSEREAVMFVVVCSLLTVGLCLVDAATLADFLAWLENHGEVAGPVAAFFFPGCRCCCPTLGFDRAASPVTQCWDCEIIIQNLASDVSRLGECKIVFAGLTGSCDNAIWFDMADWGAVKSYIEGGGRFVLSLDYTDPVPPLNCLKDIATVNSFLAALGSTIQCLGGQYSSFSNAIAGDANIAQGLTPAMSLTPELSGGRTVFLEPSGNRPMYQVEKLGTVFCSSVAMPI